MAGAVQIADDTYRVHGYCALCTAHCATIATVENGRVTRLDSDPNHPNGGVMCIKGKVAPELVYHTDRLDYPLRRTRPKDSGDPGWQRISWDEALDAIAERLLSTRERYGARSVALAKGTRSGTSVDDSERWLFRFMNLFGSPNRIGTTHICNWHRDTGVSYTLGMNLPDPDLTHSKSFLLWGHNPSHTSLTLAYDIVAARRRGMKIVAVDPRRVGISAQADILLQVRPGTDGALALALIHALIEEGWYDVEFVRHWTNGPFLCSEGTGNPITEANLTGTGSSDHYVVWDERKEGPVLYDRLSGCFERDGVQPSLFKERTLRTKQGGEILCKPIFEYLAALASRYSPERSEAITRIPAAKAWKAAHLLAHHRPASMYMWNGVGQHTNATQTSRAIATFQSLLGDIDQPGGNVVFPKVEVNAVNGTEFLSKEMASQRIGRAEKPLGPPAKPGNCAAYDVFTAILEERPYPVKALLNFGANTVMSTGDAKRARKAFSALEFAVATELFMTPTAELCDYVLPATSFLEMANLTKGFEHRPKGKARLQYRPVVVPAQAERHSDTWIIFELAKRTGLGDHFWNGDVDAGYAYELASTGITLKQLKASPGGISVPLRLRYRKYAETNQKGEARGFATPSRRVELYSHDFAAHGYSPLPEYQEPAMSPVSRPDLASDYPLVLTNAKFMTFIHSQQRALPSLRKLYPEPTAEIHPETAARFKVKNKEWMRVESPRGFIQVRAQVTDRIIPGVVCCQHGWWQPCHELNLSGHNPYAEEGANPGILIDTALADPISGSLPHRSYLCRVRPLEDSTSPA
ncbi:MAG: molybdopterin-dependent oxidoreductase [Candidatus Binatia bacterium]